MKPGKIGLEKHNTALLQGCGFGKPIFVNKWEQSRTALSKLSVSKEAESDRLIIVDQKEIIIIIYC